MSYSLQRVIVATERFQHRDQFNKSFQRAIVRLAIGLLILFASVGAAQDSDSFFQMERTVAHQGFDGESCWVHARAGVIPEAAAIPGEPAKDRASNPRVLMTTQKLLLSGSDLFYRLHQTELNSHSSKWSTLKPIHSFQRQTFGNGDKVTVGPGVNQLLQPGDQTTVCDFVPKWHAASQRLLGIGQSVWYRKNHVMPVRPRGIAYAVYDPRLEKWTNWDLVKLPDVAKFQDAGAGSGQRVDLLGGDLLLPFSFKTPAAKQYSTAVCRCRFDGHRIHYLQHGNEMTVPIKRGLYEPSLTKFQGKYYLTIRNDDHGYVSSSADGLNYSKPIRWTFDDGSDLGNYNTQQHWVTHQEKLFLTYTRRGADNDHVFRHRAPLFIAEVDPKRLCVIRATEKIVVPENGARLGNFGVTRVSEKETWITVTEWMQPLGVEKYGSDNRIHVVKLKWATPNHNDDSAEKDSPESSWNSIRPYFTSPPLQSNSASSPRSKYESVLKFADGKRMTSSKQWKAKRAQLLSDWTTRLGKWPPLLQEQRLQITGKEKKDGYTQFGVRLQWTPTEFTSGYLLVPDGDGPFPAVISVFYEPETPIGEGKPHRDFALQLTRRGFVSLSLGTSEATQANTYSLYHPDLQNAEVQPLSMLGCAAANAWYALANRSDVDADRIGIVGHSFGGKWAMFAACLFDKFACAAWSDPGIVFDNKRPSINYWEPWYLGYHPQPWRKRGLITLENPARGLYPKLQEDGVDLHQLHVLMAPRPFLVSGGSEDPIERWEALRPSIEVNRLLGFQDRVAMTNRPDHSPNRDSNEVIYRFFEKFLRPD